jgi:hypothetical protein
MLSLPVILTAQGFGEPLSIQGLQRTSIASVAARGMGSIAVGGRGDVSSMFTHPSRLISIDGPQISIGGISIESRTEQRQRWIPMRTLPTFSLMMEGLLDRIPDPDYSESPDDGFGPEDSIARPFDDIRPDWSDASSSSRPVALLAGMPVSIGGLSLFVAGGIAEYADLNGNFRNNNVLDPSIGSQRPAGIPRPAIGQEVPVMWYRYEQSRAGVLMGYGVAVAAAVNDDVSLGVSGRRIHGSTTDKESTIARGRIRFGNNGGIYFYRLDSVNARTTFDGTSTFSGLDLTLGAGIRLRSAELCISLSPPAVIERSYAGTRTVDTTGVPVSSPVSASEEFALPWRGSVGMSVDVRDDVRLALEYSMRPFAQSRLSSAGTSEVHPWLSSDVFAAGAEFDVLTWLTLRAGIRRESEVFEPEGTPLPGEPVPFTTLSLGAGVTVLGARVDIAYERTDLSYQDLWQTNVNLNASRWGRIVAGMTYTIH